nr:hypothetical protein [Tanacetum cinerariifolium]
VDPAAECLVQLVQQLRLPIARHRVYEELHRHPDHPSLLAFSDVLHAWGVPNGAYKVGEDDLPDLPTPFLAHTAAQGVGEYAGRQLAHSRVASGQKQRFAAQYLAAEPEPGPPQPASTAPVYRRPVRPPARRAAGPRGRLGAARAAADAGAG